MYEKLYVANKVHLKCQIFHLEMGKRSSVTDDKFNTNISLLASMEFTFGHKFMVLSLSQFLPNSWTATII